MYSSINRADLLLKILSPYVFAMSVGILPREAQITQWEENTDRGLTALQQGNYAEAEQLFSLALNEAEKT